MDNELKALLEKQVALEWNQKNQPELVAKIKKCLDKNECNKQELSDIIEGLNKGVGMILERIKTLELAGC